MEDMVFYKRWEATYRHEREEPRHERHAASSRLPMQQHTTRRNSGIALVVYRYKDSQLQTIVGLKRQHNMQHPNTHMCRRGSSQSPQSSNLPERPPFPYPESMTTHHDKVCQCPPYLCSSKFNSSQRQKNNVHPEIKFPQINRNAARGENHSRPG